MSSAVGVVGAGLVGSPYLASVFLPIGMKSNRTEIVTINDRLGGDLYQHLTVPHQSGVLLQLRGDSDCAGHTEPRRADLPSDTTTKF
jgi:hypothetical protein